MPTYDYECRSCGYTLEVRQGFSEDPLTDCPDCGKKDLKRLIGMGGGIIFKGSGFYVNDSRPKGSGSGSGKPKKQNSSQTTETKTPATASTGNSSSSGNSKPA